MKNAIDQAKENLDNKIAECNAIEDNLNDLKQQKKDRENDIENAQNTIKRNNEFLQKAEERRCENNLSYLSKINNINNAVNLLKYLKQKMSDSSFKNYVTSQKVALLLLKSASQGHDNSFADLTKLHLMSLVDVSVSETSQKVGGEPEGPKTKEELNKEFDTKERTAQEIGTGHVDNDKGALEGVTYDYTNESVEDYIARTIKFIDSLIGNFEDDKKSLEETEAGLVDKFLKLKTQIEKDNHVLALEIKNLQDQVAALEAEIAQVEKDLSECRDEIPGLEQIHKDAIELYNDKKAEYEKRKEDHEKMIPALEEALRIYNEKVVAAKATYKERVADYAPDQTFDKTSHEDRATNG